MVVGLGNPGRRYETTRHNAGFMVADLLADELACSFELSKKHHSLVAKAHLNETGILVAKPLTFMNNSGRAVASLARWYHIEASEILVIYDDLDLPLGRLRIRPGGSAGGHRGMQSIINALQTTVIPRVKIGIGRPATGETDDVIDYVLQPFSEADWELVSPVLLKAARAAHFILSGGGLPEAMNRFNG
ncbi:MAG: aminoacyl-tRNA hydrolase [Clostridia bacterium]|nr:aminoacyl-tRNA hydrolase [Clostridia bacterium]